MIKKLIYYLLCYLVLRLIFYIICYKLLFIPEKCDDKGVDNLLQSMDNTKQIKITTTDNKSIDAVYHNNTNSKLCVIYSHGNAGNIYNRGHMLKLLSKLGSVIMFDYRGYGMSTGYPTEKGMYYDIFGVWKYSTQVLGYNPNNIILFGESLGCSVTFWLANEILDKFGLDYKPKMVINFAGFSSVKNIANEYIPMSKYLIPDMFNSEKYINNISQYIDIYLLHSNKDTIVRINHKDKLMDASVGRRTRFIPVQGTHNEPIFTDDLMEYLRLVSLD